MIWNDEEGLSGRESTTCSNERSNEIDSNFFTWQGSRAAVSDKGGKRDPGFFCDTVNGRLPLLGEEKSERQVDERAHAAE